jgi:hypothetical protein
LRVSSSSTNGAWILAFAMVNFLPLGS